MATVCTMRTVPVHQGAETKEMLAMRLLVATARALAVPGMPAQAVQKGALVSSKVGVRGHHWGTFGSVPS